MSKIMTQMVTKTIVVRLSSDNVKEFNIDTSIFDDPYLEAATRAVEDLRKKRYGDILPIMECWEKESPNHPELYNSYWILVNASCYNKAELLREKFRMQHDCDLKKEPLHARKLRKSKS